MITRDQVSKRLFTDSKNGKASDVSRSKPVIKTNQRNPPKSAKIKRYDVSKLNSQEYDDLISGVNIDNEVDHNSTNAQKVEEAIKKKTNNELFNQVDITKNIYSDSDDDDVGPSQTVLKPGESPRVQRSPLLENPEADSANTSVTKQCSTGTARSKGPSPSKFPQDLRKSPQNIKSPLKLGRNGGQTSTSLPDQSGQSHFSKFKNMFGIVKSTVETSKKSPLKGKKSPLKAKKSPFKAKSPSKSGSQPQTSGTEESIDSGRNYRSSSKSPFKGNSDTEISQPDGDSSLLQDGKSFDNLDETLQLWKTAEVQTDPVFFLKCSCNPCTDFWCKLGDLIQNFDYAHCNQAETNTANFVVRNMPQEITPSKRQKQVNEKGEVMVCLVKGCPQVTIPLSKKANIDTAVPDGDPSKLVAYLLESLYKVEELASMTCGGKVEGTKPLPDDVASVLMVFISNRYNNKKFNFNKPLFTKYANDKFYTSRRYIWKHHPELVGNEVRAKRTKNVKNPNNDRTPKGPASRKQPTGKNVRKSRKEMDSTPQKTGKKVTVRRDLNQYECRRKRYEDEDRYEKSSREDARREDDYDRQSRKRKGEDVDRQGKRIRRNVEEDRQMKRRDDHPSRDMREDTDREGRKARRGDEDRQSMRRDNREDQRSRRDNREDQHRQRSRHDQSSKTDLRGNYESPVPFRKMTSSSTPKSDNDTGRKTYSNDKSSLGTPTPRSGSKTEVERPRKSVGSKHPKSEHVEAYEKAVEVHRRLEYGPDSEDQSDQDSNSYSSREYDSSPAHLIDSD